MKVSRKKKPQSCDQQLANPRLRVRHVSAVSFFKMGVTVKKRIGQLNLKRIMSHKLSGVSF